MTTLTIISPWLFHLGDYGCRWTTISEAWGWLAVRRFVRSGVKED